ncbi:hypothetical protein [Haloarcula nitratireducens]|uniref:Uncharacterized protein n=1 Tax=Haloarcula nitratireducens TaxID=2487749 RepID=A0AAW4PE27_9EURY|nr:hypothetical protein [Halomicroarcula nitratireducens]MBX0296252.1 hypothetical protein [Halomicroarcula nitratireducens]
MTAEGYVANDILDGNGESVAVVAEPNRTLHVPFDRVVQIRYSIAD